MFLPAEKSCRSCSKCWMAAASIASCSSGGTMFSNTTKPFPQQNCHTVKFLCFFGGWFKSNPHNRLAVLGLKFRTQNPWAQNSKLTSHFWRILIGFLMHINWPLGKNTGGLLLPNRLAGQTERGLKGWFFYPVSHLGVSKIMVPPNHPFVHRVFHYFHHPFWGTPIFGLTPIHFLAIYP